MAAQLTNWRIDIYSESKHGEMLETARREIMRIDVLDDFQIDTLVRSGFQSAQEIADADAGEISAILDIDDEGAQSIVQAADAVVEQLIMEEATARMEEGR